MKYRVGYRTVCRRSLICVGVVAALGSAASASAQNLSEIVVTAERRETTLQRTPISVIAFNEEAMELRGIETLEDIALYTPNLDIKGGRGFGNASPTYEIRGLIRRRRSDGRAVGGPLRRRDFHATHHGALHEHARRAARRGASGTARNAVRAQQHGRRDPRLHATTARPARGALRMSAGSFSRADLNAMMNVPITDTVYFRVQGATLNQDGYVRRGTQELGGSEDTIGRLQLALVPNENLRVTFAASMQSSESDGNPQDLATFDMNPNLNYQGERADWLSDFLALAGQPRLDPNNDPRLVLDDYTMPDWCFLDDGNPDWDTSCEQTNESDYSQFSVNAAWQFESGLELHLDHRRFGLRERGPHRLGDDRHEGRPDQRRVRRDVPGAAAHRGLRARRPRDGCLVLRGGLELRRGRCSSGAGRASITVPVDVRGYAARCRRNEHVPPGRSVRHDRHRDRSNHDVVRGIRELGLAPDRPLHGDARCPLRDTTRKRSRKFGSRPMTSCPSSATTSTEVFAQDDWDDTDYRLTFDYQLSDNHMVYLHILEGLPRRRI